MVWQGERRPNIVSHDVCALLFWFYLTKDNVLPSTRLNLQPCAPSSNHWALCWLINKDAKENQYGNKSSPGSLTKIQIALDSQDAQLWLRCNSISVSSEKTSCIFLVIAKGPYIWYLKIPFTSLFFTVPDYLPSFEHEGLKIRDYACHLWVTSVNHLSP